MSGRRFEGRNLEEAIASAAEALGVEPYRLSYHIAVQKRGFLGGTKRIVIEAEIRSGSEDGEVAETTEPGVPAPGVREGREVPAQAGRRRGRTHRGERGGEATDAPIPEQQERSEQARAVAEWCERVAALADLRLVVRTTETDEEIAVALSGRDERRVTERGGELLDALQVLASKAFQGRLTEKRIEMDAAGFKAGREARLSRRARELAERVRRDGREQILPAMTPIERRIVHVALRDDAEVTTESRGEGFLKRVVIAPRARQADADD